MEPMQRVDRRPQVVAHRGSSHDKPEHTLSAYVAALDTGAEGLECDVRLTADGHLVCVHDRGGWRDPAGGGTAPETATGRSPPWTSRSSTSSTSGPGRDRGEPSTTRCPSSTTTPG